MPYVALLANTSVWQVLDNGVLVRAVVETLSINHHFNEMIHVIIG